MEYDFSSIRIVDEPLTLQILLHCSGVNRFRGRERENVMTDTSLADSGGCRSQQFGLAKCNWYHYIPLTHLYLVAAPYSYLVLRIITRKNQKPRQD